MGRSMNESNAMNTSRHPVLPAIRPTIPWAGHFASVTEDPRVSRPAVGLLHESSAEHLKRITNREFKTMRLGSQGELA